MPVFRFRLEAQDGSGHFRQGTIEEESKERARMVLEKRERDFAAFQLSEEQHTDLLERHVVKSLDDLPFVAPVDETEDEKAVFRALPVADRARLNIHRQEQPYKLVKLEAV